MEWYGSFAEKAGNGMEVLRDGGAEVRLDEDGMKVKMKSARTCGVGAISVPVQVYRVQFCCLSIQIIVKSFGLVEQDQPVATGLLKNLEQRGRRTGSAEFSSGDFFNFCKMVQSRPFWL